MPRIQSLKFTRTADGEVKFNRADLVLLSERERRALEAAVGAIEDRVAAAYLDSERVRGTVHLSGCQPRVTFKRAGMDPVGPTEIDDGEIVA